MQGIHSVVRSRTAVITSALCTAFSLLAVAPLTHAGDILAIGSATKVQLVTPGSDGDLEHYAGGAGAAVTFIEPDGEFSFGMEANAWFLTSDGGERVYDLGVSVLFSYGLDDKKAVPFLAVGLDLAGVTAPNVDTENTHRVMAGVHGGVGVHGFLSDKIYWRGQVGFLGAGPGGITGAVSLGYVFGDL